MRIQAHRWQMTAPQAPLERVDFDVEPGAGEVVVEIAGCGVCHTDLGYYYDGVRTNQPLPLTLGHEISGTVAALGPDVTGFAEGDRVVGAFIMPCGRCRYCERGRDDMCETFFAQNRLAGNLLDGTSRLVDADGGRLSMYSMAGLAQYAVVPVTALAALPDGLPLVQSATLGCAAFTAFGAWERAGVQPGDSVAVVAVGGVGSALLQLAAHHGVERIVAIDVDDAKLRSARELGATLTVDSSTEDVVAAVRDRLPGGVDRVFEALGRPETLETAMGLVADGGTVVAVGIAAGDATARVPITPLVRRGQTLCGSFGARTRRDLPRVLEVAAAGGLDVTRTVSRSLPLAEVDAAYKLLDRGGIVGRADIDLS